MLFLVIPRGPGEAGLPQKPLKASRTHPQEEALDDQGILATPEAAREILETDATGDVPAYSQGKKQKAGKKGKKSLKGEEKAWEDLWENEEGVKEGWSEGGEEGEGEEEWWLCDGCQSCNSTCISAWSGSLTLVLEEL